MSDIAADHRKKLGKSIINLVAKAWWEREGRWVASRQQPFLSMQA